MNVEIRAEAGLFPEKEYINGIAVAVCAQTAIFFAELCSKNAREISIVLWFAADK
jgi:hypothetical protein